MFTDALRAFGQVFEPPFRAILGKSLAFTLAVLLVIWIGLQALFAGYVDLPYPWLDAVLSILTGIGAIFALGFLVAPVTALFAGLFQDDVAEIVERTDYAGEQPGRAMPLGASLASTVKFTGIVILGNLLALVLLLVPGVNLIAFLVVNAYLLGREFFEFAAMRFMPPAEARALRKANSGTVFFGGLVIAGLLAVPLVNLVTPVFATIFMVHVMKRVSSRNRL
ncbi:sulfate transporter family protein [Pannonibacter tanglangensis]|uniref:Sulfate transporter family protein n=1 Tax=Pannonibacter tanglangensis TaxID=2750084 RepID=A0ABW9ZRF3_9HYPH|nr:sulfate transporter family protein [Pannonibacter sp. XCT-34]NBN65627.1 sulfate transporter family protein [Pannonibacter sp. XCT-34]